MRSKLAFSGDNWITTFIRLTDAHEDRRLEIKTPQGILGIEFGLCGKSRSFLAVTITTGKKSSPTPLKRKKAA